MRNGHAVVFDLDDTLYPLSQFVRSGFRAIAAHLASTAGVPPMHVLDTLHAAHVSARGRELQILASRLGLDLDVVPTLVDVIRRHVPELRLPELSRAVLRALRGGWALGIVTNGRPDIQQRKVRALGLTPLVDAVVYADGLGEGCAKPAAAPFLEMCRRLRVAPEAAIFVGNDPVADIAGAHAVGLRTIFLTAGDTPTAAPDADLVVRSLAEVPAAAERWHPHEWRAHVA